MEALSDGVFALAIAILLLSSSVPGSFHELWLFVQDLPAFGVCIIFIYWIWRQQVAFFLRYGLYDSKTSILTLGLLFFVLFYVYPLKFLMTWLMQFFAALITGNLFQESDHLSQMIPMDKMPYLMVLYGVGFICIWWVLYLLYSHALSKAEYLGLNEIELYETKYSLMEKKTTLLIGVLSVGIALLGLAFEVPVAAAVAGWTYNLIWITTIINLRRRKKQLQLLQADVSI